jgi:hypothetical protein
MQYDGAETVALVLNVYCIKHISAYKSRLDVICLLIWSVEWHFIKPVLWSLSVSTLAACAATVLLKD